MGSKREARSTAHWLVATTALWLRGLATTKYELQDRAWQRLRVKIFGEV